MDAMFRLPLRHVLQWTLFAAATAGALLLSGCGKSGPSRGADAQVAARVNDDDITVHQVQLTLQRQLRGAPDQGDAVARRVLDQLVEQELSAQAARESGLDREPGVVQALEAARREVLARAWQDRQAATATRPGSDEVDRYFAEHPDLFAQRRIYTLQETLVEARDADQEKVEQVARASRDAGDLEDKLTAARLRFQTRQYAQAAEEVPIPLLEPLAKMGVGQSLPVRLPTTVRVYTVLHAQSAPVERRVATEPISAFLLTQRQREAVRQGMQGVRAKAHIEYRGSFAQGASAPASASR
jgi:EpsD family peptidyl-prolyl cis-trans isomerase